MYIRKSPVRVSIKGYKLDDCTIIAIGNSLGISYDLSRKLLQTITHFDGNNIEFKRNKPKTKKEFYLMDNVRMVCNSLSTEEIKFTSSKGDRLTLKEFAENNNEGIYIALVENHLVSVIDGTILDTWDSSSRKMIYAYKINLKQAHKRIEKIAEFYKMNTKEHMQAV